MANSGAQKAPCDKKQWRCEHRSPPASGAGGNDLRVVSPHPARLNTLSERPRSAGGKPVTGTARPGRGTNSLNSPAPDRSTKPERADFNVARPRSVAGAALFQTKSFGIERAERSRSEGVLPTRTARSREGADKNHSRDRNIVLELCGRGAVARVLENATKQLLTRAAFDSGGKNGQRSLRNLARCPMSRLRRADAAQGRRASYQGTG